MDPLPDGCLQMNAAQTSIAVGVLLAIVATLGWALNFIAPYVTAGYSLYDLMAVRFLIAGVLGVMGMTGASFAAVPSVVSNTC